MLSALFGAMSATLLAFAPVMASAANNADITSSVRSAYYDASQVSNYGTTVRQIYNYTGYGMHSGDLSIEESLVANGASTTCGSWNEEGYTWLSITEDGSNSFGFGDDATFNGLLDVYLNGTFVVTLESVPANTQISDYGWPDGSRLYIFKWDVSLTPDINMGTSYIWLFEHYSASGYEFGTDTVADIAEGLTSGIGTVATGIGGGLQSLMQNIFLVGTVDGDTGAFTATGLSAFGIVTVVFCGLALALGLCRWVVGFATSLGSRNR